MNETKITTLRQTTHLLLIIALFTMALCDTTLTYHDGKKYCYWVKIPRKTTQKDKKTQISEEISHKLPLKFASFRINM